LAWLEKPNTPNNAMINRNFFIITSLLKTFGSRFRFNLFGAPAEGGKALPNNTAVSGTLTVGLLFYNPVADV
jgi:hypothetical protein